MATASTVLIAVVMIMMAAKHKDTARIYDVVVLVLYQIIAKATAIYTHLELGIPWSIRKGISCFSIKGT